MDISLVIVNWNTCGLLADCLQSIFDSAGDLDVEVIVVDNASTDGSQAMLRASFPQVHMIANGENVGFARANNQAIRVSGGRYVLLLNSDTKVHPGALQTLLAFMDAHLEAGAVGARLLNADGSLQPSCHPLLTPWREFWRLMFLDRIWRRATYDMRRWDQRIPRAVDVIKGACLFLRRVALEQVGLLDEQYFMYSEEMDLCYRLKRGGWQLYYVPQAHVTHYGEASSRKMAERMYLELYRSKVQFQRKVGGASQARLFKGLTILVYLPRWLVARVGGMARPEWRKRAYVFWRLLATLPWM